MKNALDELLEQTFNRMRGRDEVKAQPELFLDLEGNVAVWLSLECGRL